VKVSWEVVDGSVQGWGKCRGTVIDDTCPANSVGTVRRIDPEDVSVKSSKSSRNTVADPETNRAPLIDCTCNPRLANHSFTVAIVPVFLKQTMASKNSSLMTLAA